MQVTEEFALIAGDELKVASVYGGVPLKAQAQEAKDAHVIVATPGRLQDLVDRGLVVARRRRGARARRGRPHARHGLQAAGRPARPQAARRPADDVLLGDARRRGRRARAPLHALPGPLRGRAAGRAPHRRRRPSLRPGHAGQQGLDARRAAAAGRARSRARLRAHEGRRRPARREAAPPRRRRGRDSRRQGPGAARAARSRASTPAR